MQSPSRSPPGPQVRGGVQIDCLGCLRINYAIGHNYGQTGKQDRNILKLRTARVGSTRSNEVVLRILLFPGLVEAISILLLPSVEYCSLSSSSSQWPTCTSSIVITGIGTLVACKVEVCKSACPG